MLKKIGMVNILVLFFCFTIEAMEEQSVQQNNQLQLIVLNGTSCAGKSSLAKELVKQARAQGIPHVYHISFDDLYISLASSPDYFSNQKEYFESKGKIIFLDPRVSESQTKMQQYFLLFYEQLKEKIERKKKGGKNPLIITDICFSTPESFVDFLETFQAYKHELALIKVFCSYEVAYKRLQKRNSSNDATQHRIEWCFEQHYKQPKFSIIYDNKEYDAGINTSAVGPEQAAQKLSYLFYGSQKEDTFTHNLKTHSSALISRYSPHECAIQ